VTDLTSQKSNADIVLTWSEVTTDTLGHPTTIWEYIVYRATDPTTVPTDSIGATSGAAFTDPGAAGSTITNYYYVVRAVDETLKKSAISNMAGEFDRALDNAR